MTLSNEDLYNEAMSMSGDVENTFLDLGRTLRQLLDRDPELFQKVIDRSALGRRKAYDLVEISSAFDPLRVSRARLKKLGSTNLSLIAKQVNQDNLEKLLQVTENTNSEQLERRMKGEAKVGNAACVLKYFSPKEYKELEKGPSPNTGRPVILRVVGSGARRRPS
jgi:hypothetical protein